MSEQLEAAIKDLDVADRMQAADTPPELVIGHLSSAVNHLASAVQTLERQHEKEKGE